MNKSLQNTINNAAQHWPFIDKIVQQPQSEKEYEKLIRILDGLLDKGGRDEKHPLARLVHLISDNIETYENSIATDFEKKLSPVRYLKLLMKTHDLKQKDLPEIGQQSVVSAILNGKRKLNARQIKALAKRFHVDAGVFIV